MDKLWTLLVAASTLTVGVASAIVIYDRFSVVWLRPDWARRLFWRHNIAGDLESLVRFLGRVQGWLGSMDSDLIADIRRQLCHVTWRIWTEALAYIALHSKDVEKRKSAIRNLSQVEDSLAIEHSMATLKSIVDEQVPTERDRHVKEVAKAALAELAMLPRTE
jgi:hypothetical protein